MNPRKRKVQPEKDIEEKNDPADEPEVSYFYISAFAIFFNLSNNKFLLGKPVWLH